MVCINTLYIYHAYLIFLPNHRIPFFFLTPRQLVFFVCLFFLKPNSNSPSVDPATRQKSWDCLGIHIFQNEREQDICQKAQPLLGDSAVRVLSYLWWG